MARGALVGREAAVETIFEVLDGDRVPIVRGPGGIGKSAVLGEVADRWNGPTLRVAGIDFLGRQGLLPFERAVEAPLVGDLESVASQVRATVGEDGLVLVDNLQWADRDSIALLPALVARGPLVLAIRSTGTDHDWPCQALAALDHVDVGLSPLCRFDAANLLVEVGPGLPARTADDVVRLAAGNPLLLELLAHAQGSLDPHGEDLVEAMLLALPHDAIEVLARLSVGLRVGGDAIGADMLVELAMISRSDDGWCHLEAELLASSAMRQLHHSQREDLHREAAEVAEAADSPAVAAEHLILAGDPVAARRLALEAVARAEPDPPSSLLLLALEVTPVEERWPLVERSVHELMREGEVVWAGDVAAAERARGHEDSRYDILDAYVAMQQGDGPRAVALLDGALEQASGLVPDDLTVGTLALRAGARASVFDVAGAREDATRVLEIGGDGDSCAAARFVLAGTALLAGDDSWRDQLPLALAEARQARSRPLEVGAGTTLVYGLFLSGDRDAAIGICTDLIASAVARHDERTEYAIAKLLNVHLVFCDLAPRSVLVELDGLLRHPANRDDLTGGWTVAAIGWSDRGELDRADEAVGRARIEATRGGPNGELAASWALAELAWRKRSPAWCEEHARHGLARSMMLNPAHANCASLVAWSQFELGRPVEVAAPYVPFPAAGALAVEIAAVQALSVGDHERAADLFAQAQKRHERYFRRSALRCQWGIAEAQRRDGDAEGALVTLKDLEEICARSEVTFMETRIAESIRRCDPGDRRARGSGRSVVTARQLEVLSLVHGGLRTPEIAQRLGLSPATVDTHIRGAMDRLGVSSRAEAARMAIDASDRPEGRG